MNITRILGGKYPLSVGTALVLECDSFDMRKWPNLLYVNLRTLYRNYVASIPVEQRGLLKPAPFIQDYLNEVAEFERIIKELSHNRIKVFFYYPEYKDLTTVLPYTDFKEYNPDNFDEVEVNLWKHVKQHGLMTPFNYEIVTQGLPPANEAVLLLSSFVVDLLSASQFPILFLLESYTGKIKRRQEWYTKINAGKLRKQEVTVPFNKFTIQIFGDKSGALKGSDKELRKVVREMAIKDHW